MRRPILIIDISAIIFGLLVFILGSRNYDGKVYLAPTALTVLRLFQLIRLLYVDRKAQTWVLLSNVIYKHKFELITSVYIGFIILLLSSYLILVTERDQKKRTRNKYVSQLRRCFILVNYYNDNNRIWDMVSYILRCTKNILW